MQFASDSDRWAAINALRYAAEAYEGFAKEAHPPRIKDQFQRQAKDAFRIADQIECEPIALVPCRDA